MKHRREILSLESGQLKLDFDTGGGGIVGFSLTDARLKGAGVTPLAWNNPGPEELDHREMSHFIVCDRWGPPSPAEAANGMPFNGEATHRRWKIVDPGHQGAAVAEARVSLELPLARLSLVRRMRLGGTVMKVEERITSHDVLGRPWNLIEHATIGPPFLDEHTVVDTAVGQGFTQEFALRTPVPEEPVVGWPCYDYEGRTIDMRRLGDDAGPLVTSYVFPDGQTIGWVTACNPGRELLIGYVWKTAQFPWLNLWRHVENGRPKARGLEFGTTGLIQPMPVLAAKMRIFDRPLFSWIEPQETLTREFLAFLTPVPADFAGVAEVQIGTREITLIERGTKARRIAVDTTLAGSL